MQTGEEGRHRGREEECAEEADMEDEGGNSCSLSRCKKESSSVRRRRHASQSRCCKASSGNKWGGNEEEKGAKAAERQTKIDCIGEEKRAENGDENGEENGASLASRRILSAKDASAAKASRRSTCRGDDACSPEEKEEAQRP